MSSDIDVSEMKSLLDFEVKRAIKTDSGCLETQSYVDSWGYGQAYFHGRKVLLHRAVLSEELGRWLEKDELACHKCHNRKCINVNHLYLGDSQSNVDDMIAAGRISDKKGEANGYCRLSNREVLSMRKIHKTGRYTHRQIAERFGVSRPRVSEILRGEAWTHI